MDLSGMVQTWVAATSQPGEEVFQKEKGKADLSSALIWIVMAAILAAIFGAIGAVVDGFLNLGSMTDLNSRLTDPSIPPEMRQFLALFSSADSGGLAVVAMTFCFIIIFNPIGFLIGSGIYFLFAKLFQGRGSFEEQTYLLATFTAPLTIITSVVGVVPILGDCLNFFLWIYQLVLSYFAIKVAHNLESGQAVGVILLPIVVLFACICCAALGIGGVIGVALQR